MDINNIFNSMFIFMVAFTMMRVADRALEAPEKPKMLGYGTPPPGYKPTHGSPREPIFPVEARKDITFCKHMYELEKAMGRPLTGKELSEKWDNWKQLRYRSKTEEERKLTHSLKYGTEDLPPRGSGSPWR